MLPRYQMFYAGAWHDARDTAVLGSVNPVNGEIWAEVADASPADVSAAVEAAHNAFHVGPWSKMSGTERAQLMRKLAVLLAENAERLGKTETTDTGKLLRETRWQAMGIARTYDYYAGCADKIEGTIPPFDGGRHMSLVFREPIGVIAAIVPWNSQLHLAAYKIAPALAAGNTIVVKASEHASCAMVEFARIVDAAGFPPGVINIVTGGPAAGAALVRHPLVRRVSFTGGAATAREVIRLSAENIAKLSLELGGKSPVIVCEDADMDSAVNGVIAGIFAATGQSCVAGSRLLLSDKIYDKFLERLTARARTIRIGDPLDEASDIGPLATLRQREKIEDLIGQSVAQGARVLVGGKRPEQFPKGFFFEPTIIECDHQALPVVANELFGPVLSVMRFRTDAEAIELANDSPYAFAGGIFTQSINRAMTAARAVRCGRFWINTYRIASFMVPFGGSRESGFGREAGLDAIEDYTETKSVIMDVSGIPISDPFVMRG